MNGLKRIVVLFLFGVGLSGFCAPEKVIVEDYLDMANAYKQSGNYQKALEYINMIEKVCPDDVKVKSEKTLIMKTLGLPEESKKALKEAEKEINYTEEQEPSVFEVSELPKMQIDTAEEDTKVEFDTGFYNKKGREYYEDGEFKKAIDYFNKALEIKKNPSSLNNIAMVYWNEGNYPKALKYFKKATAADKSYTRALLNMSLFYKQQKNDKKRLECLQSALSRNIKDFNAHYLLGQYYVEKENYKAAIKSFSLSIEKNPNSLNSYLALAAALYEVEDYQNTYLVLEKAKTVNPNSDRLYYLLAKTAILTGRAEEAVSSIQKAIEMNSNTSYYYEQAKIEFFLGNYQNAKQILKEHFKDIENSEIYNYLGLSEYKLGFPEEAIFYFKKAINYGAKSIYYYNAALCYKSMDNKKMYTKALEEAMKLKPSNYQDYIDLSYIYNDLNNPAYAKAMLDMGIEKFPNNKKLYMAKLKLLEISENTMDYIELKKLMQSKFGV